MREGDAEPLALFNEALLLVMADGTFRQLTARWLGLDPPAWPHHGGWRLPVRALEYLDENGVPSGHVDSRGHRRARLEVTALALGRCEGAQRRDRRADGHTIRQNAMRWRIYLPAHRNGLCGRRALWHARTAGLLEGLADTGRSTERHILHDMAMISAAHLSWPHRKMPCVCCWKASRCRAGGPCPPNTIARNGWQD